MTYVFEDMIIFPRQKSKCSHNILTHYKVTQLWKTYRLKWVRSILYGCIFLNFTTFIQTN